MPFKDYNRKLEYNRNYVKHYRGIEEGLRLNLNGIKKRLYVCELCGDVGNTQFHEFTSNPLEVVEVCHDCHEFIRLDKFDENKMFM